MVTEETQNTTTRNDREASLQTLGERQLYANEVSSLAEMGRFQSLNGYRKLTREEMENANMPYLLKKLSL